MTWIKVCGQTTPLEIAAAAEADAMGFVVEYPADVPWNLSRGAAAALMRLTPPNIERVAIVGDDYAQIVAIVDEVQPDSVQLHADEPITETARITAAMHERGIRVIKALRFDVETGLSRHGGDPVEVAQQLIDAGIDRLLVDSVSATKAAGTGQPVDHATAQRIVAASSIPVVLAGGLTPENVAAVIQQVEPWGVDVISGVEGPGHRKDPELVRAFISAVRG